MDRGSVDPGPGKGAVRADCELPRVNARVTLLSLLAVLLITLATLAQEVDSSAVAPQVVGQLLYVDRQPLDKLGDGWRQVLARQPQFAGSSFVGPQSNGWTGLAVKAMGKMPAEEATLAARELSSVLKGGVLHLALTSDGRVWYFFWDEGKLVDRYCSNPGRPEEVTVEVVRSWQGRPELLLPVSRGTPTSNLRSEVSITDFNGFLYSYYPEMRTERPAAWRSPADLMAVLVQVVGVPQAPAPFSLIAALPGWTRLTAGV